MDYMQEFSTPMMKQYMAIKKKYQDCLLLYRMGDFYELFLEDAHIGAKVLNITLTGKSNGKSGRIPMAGVPYHAVDAYLTKLVKAGYKVAICEQVSLPNKYGLVDREVIRVVTPGTVLDEKALEQKENNYIVSIICDNERFAVSAADISTGQFFTSESEVTNLDQQLKDELAKLRASECILPEYLYNDPEFLKILKQERNLNIYCFKEWDTFADKAEEVLKKQFSVSSLLAFGMSDKPLAMQTSAALLGYLKETQKGTLSHIKKIELVDANNYVILDRSTMINLELFSTIREHDTKGSLLNVLDQTLTPMGGRMLKEWLRKPLTDKERINERLDAVQTFSDDAVLRLNLRELLKQVNDIERLLSRLSVGLGNARDMKNLRNALEIVIEIKEQIKNSNNQLIKELSNEITQEINKVITLIDATIVEEPPIDTKSGGVIQKGVNTELDGLRNIVNGSKNWIKTLEEKERKRTKISSLKVRFNKVFGFYIEISRANARLVPNDYIRKQTLVNSERFITPELKHHEEIILSAEEKINALEYQLFCDVLKQILANTSAIQNAAQCIGTLDCLTNFAFIAERDHYTRPKLLFSGELRIKKGRHAVVEKLLENDKQFVPNNVTLDNINQQLLLITGPNMAGKSVFIRQVALIVLLAHIGCFVPAESAYISLVDRIFVRSGASDVITSGLSTFMVEMVETAHILHYATKNSLIVMDEIGRGTSTYDGISIAWAVAEYLVTQEKTSPKTLFATHYHELESLEQEYPTKIKNFHMAVTEQNGQPIFLHTILPGGASHSFGVAVAKLAGIPEKVIDRANEILHALEKRDPASLPVIPNSVRDPMNFSTKPHGMLKQVQHDNDTNRIVYHLIHKELSSLDVANMTPLEALNKLADLKEKLKLFTAEEKSGIQVD